MGVHVSISKSTRNKRVTVWLKTGQALALAVAICFTLGASDAGSRYTSLSHKMMCTCSCAQMLGECNHVGCPSSGPMLNELSADIAGGQTDKQILNSFAVKYGATVLAAPTTEGFNLVAWIAPFAVFAAALLGTILLVRHWSVGKSQFAAELDPDPNSEMAVLRDRIRHETGGEEEALTYSTRGAAYELRALHRTQSCRGSCRGRGVSRRALGGRNVDGGDALCRARVCAVAAFDACAAGVFVRVGSSRRLRRAI